MDSLTGDQIRQMQLRSSPFDEDIWDVDCPGESPKSSRNNGPKSGRGGEATSDRLAKLWEQRTGFFIAHDQKEWKEALASMEDLLKSLDKLWTKSIEGDASLDLRIFMQFGGIRSRKALKAYKALNKSEFV